MARAPKPNFIARPAWAFSKGWAIQKSGASRAMRVGLTRADAWKEVRRRARSAGTTAFLVGTSGRIIAMNQYG